MPSFDIIITVWNRLDHTKRTIASLIATGIMADCARFIVVDNRSTEEGMQEFLDDLWKHTPETAGKMFLLKRSRNEGWGIAVNDALGLSRAEYVLLINNDVEFAQDAIKQALESFAHQSNIGILALWRHTAHGFVHGGVQNEWFREMDNVPAVAWFMAKSVMQVVGMLPEHGPCLTKGGNGEDTGYVGRMKQMGYLTGVPAHDLATHIDGY